MSPELFVEAMVTKGVVFVQKASLCSSFYAFVNYCLVLVGPAASCEPSEAAICTGTVKELELVLINVPRIDSKNQFRIESDLVGRLGQMGYRAGRGLH